MKKASAGLVCVLLAVIIAVFSAGCNNGGGELTYTADRTSSTDNQNVPVTDTPSSQAGPETVVYPLTTQQGETVQVLSTTLPSTEVPTMNYDPVTVPTMPTTYVSTTQYVPPTYTPSASNQVTTKTTTTTESTTEKKTKKISVDSFNTDGNFTDKSINLYVSEPEFGSKINATSGSLTINFGTTTYKANYKVHSELYAGESVQIDIGVPTALLSAIESTDAPFITVTVPEGAIVSKDNVINKKFTSIPIYY